MFIILSFVKIFHWLVQDRVDFIETTPNVTRLQHIRIVAFTLVLLVSARQTAGCWVLLKLELGARRSLRMALLGACRSPHLGPLAARRSPQHAARLASLPACQRSHCWLHACSCPCLQGIDIWFLHYSIGRTMERVRANRPVGVDLLFAFEYTVQVGWLCCMAAAGCAGVPVHAVPHVAWKMQHRADAMTVRWWDVLVACWLVGPALHARAARCVYTRRCPHTRSCTEPSTPLPAPIERRPPPLCSPLSNIACECGADTPACLLHWSGCVQFSCLG